MDLKIEYVDIDTIKPYVNNAKEHPKEQIEQIKKSIQEFGFKDAVGVWKNEVVEGHGRLLAAKELGMKEIPIVRLDDLTDEQRKAYGLVHNQLTMNSGFDLDTLKVELDNIGEIDMSEFGFSLDGIGEEPQEVQEDDFDEEPPAEPKAKRGEIYSLGNHRLMCGDSTSAEDVAKLMDGEKADMVFTDPPYLMGFEGNVHADGSKSHNAKFGPIKNDKMSKEDGDQFILDIFTVIKEFCVGAYYVSFYRLGLDYIFRALEKLNNKYKSLIIWNKGVHTLSNSDYMSKYEPIVYGWFNEHNFYGDRSNFDIWDIQRTQKNDLHPTMKPVALVAKAIQNSSKRGGLVLDLFGGSGSTLIACEQLNRKCYMMELDPKYVDVIIKRWEEYTGRKAVLISGENK